MKIKDKTSNIYNLEELSKENNLRGFFVQEMLKLLSNCPQEKKEQIYKALDIGLEILK